MPVQVRRQPSMDLRSAAKADAAAQRNSDAFSFTQSVDMDMEAPANKQTQQKNLRLATSSDVLQHQYQSDEEAASPTYVDARDSQEEDADMADDDMDFEDLEILPTITATDIARAIPIVYTGKPTVINISAMAPMQKRQTPITRPTKLTQSSSTTNVPAAIPRRSSLRNKAASRTISMYEPPQRTYSPTPSVLSVPITINFSAPLRGSSLSPKPSPLSSTSPPQLMAPGSPSSSYDDSDISSSMDEAEALMRESEEIQVRTHSMERERRNALDDNDLLDKPPTPTKYEEYDPFGVQPPTLSKTKTLDEDSRRWKGLNLAKKVRLGRRGRGTEAVV